MCHLRSFKLYPVHRSRSHQFCVLRAIQMLRSPPKFKSCCRLMKVWWMNSRLDWTLVVSECDKIFSFMDIAIFITSVTVVAMVTVRNRGLTPVARSYRQYSRPYCKLLLPLFHQGSSNAGSEPEPSFKPVLCFSTPKAPAPNQEKWFVSSTKTLLG